MRLQNTILLTLVGLGLLIALSLNLFAQPEKTAIAAPCEYDPAAYVGLNPDSLSRELETRGLIGEIHGVNSPLNMTVLSVREPENFFSHQEFSVIAANDTVQAQLNDLHRHDRVCLQGTALKNPSPQPHIRVEQVQVLGTWDGLAAEEDYGYAVDLPALLRDTTEQVGIVHAIGAGGKILVMGFGDAIAPLVVDDPQWTANLYRGDIIRVHYQIQTQPNQPPHLRLDPAVAEPVEMIDAIVAEHGQPATLTGSLVKFPQSPQLKFDVYGLDVVTHDIHRIFTLINFSDMDTFTALRERLAQLWDAQADTAQRDRNSLINPNITLTATGTINVISPDQANPQLLIDTVNDITPTPAT
ncbi:hypothetical protein PN441_19500 [Spirulina major CS-329]|uniref:hypothetical protein n=1 Tax=Spirulina TaxID=1154 RepID=UPI00232E62B8|nr:MULTISPECIES: hypothetical protein [Spirulina]MDB9494642.1 hypothetical protein [Spirulina subsalsa CS-330]MDB9505270.1 hypothetical protein [Spirulina major CS-329]